MINIVKFIFDELKTPAVEFYVQDRIFNKKAPVKTPYPLITLNAISDSKIDWMWRRDEVHQISIWGKDPDENEKLKNVIVSKFFKLKKAPITSATIRSINETKNNKTGSFGIHIRVKIVALEKMI